MGCIQSQQPQTIEEKKKLHFSIEPTKIPEFDQVFESIAESLQTLLSINETFSNGKRTLKLRVGVRKRLQNSSLNDVLMAMMYCYSTSCNGDFTQLQLTTVKKQPFIDVDRKAVRKEFQQIPPAFETFVANAVQASEELEPLVRQVEEAAKQCSDFPERAASLASGTGLGVVDISRAVLHTKNNVQTLLKARPLAQQTLKKVKDVLVSLERFVDQLETLDTMEEIRRIGQAANEAQCFVPEDIVATFWPDRSRLLPLTSNK